MIIRRPKQTTSRNQQNSKGMGLIEVLLAMIILMVGLIALLSTLAFAMSATHASSQDMMAKQLASEAMENIFTARNSNQLVWLQIQNQGAGTIPDGIFLPGLVPINQAPTAGNNAGLLNTPEYVAGAPKVLTQAGPDGIMGTLDDIQMPLTNFKRSISIVSVPGTSDQLRTITINVQYNAPPMNIVKNYTLQGYISQFR